MGDSEVVRLAGSAVAGDYASLWPLIDRLKESGDDRWLMVVEIVGNAAGQAFSIRAAWALGIRKRLQNLFWPELAEGGPLALLERLAQLAREQETPRVGMIGRLLPYDSGTGITSISSVPLTDERGNRIGTVSDIRASGTVLDGVMRISNDDMVYHDGVRFRPGWPVGVDDQGRIVPVPRPPSPAQCSACEGVGYTRIAAVSNQWDRCPSCRGDGLSRPTEDAPQPAGECSECYQGQGRRFDEPSQRWNFCHACNGTGRAPQEGSQ